MLASNNGEKNRTNNYSANWQLKTLGYLFKQEHIRNKDLKIKINLLIKE